MPTSLLPRFRLPTSTPSLSTTSFFSLSLPTAVCVLIGLFLHARYLVHVSEPNTQIPDGVRIPSIFSRSSSSQQTTDGQRIPDMFIFRRSKKTGSTSMATALLQTLIPLGYHVVASKNFEVDVTVRNEFIRAFPRRLFIVHHNQITRTHHLQTHVNVHVAAKNKKRLLKKNDDEDDEDDELDLNPSETPEIPSFNEPFVYFNTPQTTARGKIVIADTIRDGYSQITSYCRHVRNVSSCALEDMAPCFRSSITKTQISYRFPPNGLETDENYIDLPLSAAHPALSSTVLRTVYPTISPLRVDRYNSRKYACKRNDTVYQVYLDEGFDELDRHTDVLRKRMLLIAGYPTAIRKVEGKDVNVKLSEIMDAAERIEQQKYKDAGEAASFWARPKSAYRKSALLAQLLAKPKIWTLDENGKVVLKQRRTEIQVDETDLKKDSLW